MKSLLLRSASTSYISCSYLYTAHNLQGISRQAVNAMGKVLGVNKKKKNRYSQFPVMPSPEVFSHGSQAGKPSPSSRRATVLNKLFMRHITDQMATGEYANEILGHGIVVNKVQVNPDYKILKVYWLANSGADDEAIEKILEKTSGYLRHELSELRLMGRVPNIKFVKDKGYANIVALERTLDVADFGEDYIRPDPVQKLKYKFELCTSLGEDIKKSIANIESEADAQGIREEYPIPPMPQNVLGLDHADILSRVKKLMKKSEAVHRLSNSENSEDKSWATFKLAQPINEDPVSFGSDSSQRQAFKKFLQNRQLLKQKLYKQKYGCDAEYTKEELRELRMQFLEQLSIVEKEDNDYIEEHVDEDK